MSTGSFNRGASLRFGTMTRLWCPSCKAETVHDRGLRCVITSCRHQYVMQTSGVEFSDWATPLQRRKGGKNRRKQG
jgi:hypothetical protein